MSDQSSAPAHAFDLGGFREPERARRDLNSILGHTRREMVRLLLSLLADSPEPDQALSLFERLIAESAGGGDSPLPLFDKDPRLLHYVVTIFGHSYWLGETLVKNRDLLDTLQREKKLERSLGREQYRERLAAYRAGATGTGTEISELLARFRKREYVRIALRDVLGVATLAVTTGEISALTDALIEAALEEAQSLMRRRFAVFENGLGERRASPSFAVLALGKLGGEELNYSSDVDLLYLYDDPEEMEMFALHEYFVRQAQLLTDILSRPTPEGAVFRIDLRLRPQGNEGELAIGLRRAIGYYAHEAHDWELQALIKARICAGDGRLVRRFIRGVEPYVYTPDVNFQAIETALHSKQKIGAQRPGPSAAHRGPGTVDVKLDSGGIRDIEFLAQCLQRVYGGEEPWLRSSGTLFALQTLHDKGHLSGQDFHELTQAYELLRRVEHRLQLQRGQQLHRLPSEPEALQALQRATGRGAGDNGAGSMLTALQARMAAVRMIYERVVYSQKRIEKEGPAAFRLTPAPANHVREMSYEQIMQRIAMDSPDLHAVISHSGCGLHARRNLHRFLSSALTSPDRYAELLENPAAVAKAIELFGASDYLADVLIRHPDAIRGLDRLAQTLGPSLFDVAPTEPFSPFSAVAAAGDGGQALALLRRDFRVHALINGARSILQALPVYESLRENTRIADAAIRCALRVTGGEESLAVFALGRLGTSEFDTGSDADLLFCRAAHTDPERARMQAEKLVHALAAYTREGTIFAVDARLRPRGGEGELVVTPDELQKYLTQEAQPWEALTYTKLRFVAGDRQLAEDIMPAVHSRMVRMSAQPGFSRAVFEMRMRLEKSNRYERSFKLAAGGFYDIDFLASHLMLQAGRAAPENIDERLEKLQQIGRVSPETTEILRGAARLYRTVDHAIRLVTGRPRPELPTAEHARAATEALVNRILKRPAGLSVQDDLDIAQGKVREIFLVEMQQAYGQ